MEAINIKFDEEQLKDIVEKVTENIIKEAKKDLITELTNEEINEKASLMYLEVNETRSGSKKEKIYYGYAFNTMSKDYASELNSSYRADRKKIEELKEQGWKEEVVYK